MVTPTFTSLPYKLRQQIYHEYFKLDDGYVCNASGKLTTADKQPIDLSLIYTCRLIASEAKDTPLAVNIISFSTIYSRELSPWAGRFQYLIKFYTLMEADLVLRLAPYITPEMWPEIATKFPQFSSTLRSILEQKWLWNGYIKDWGSLDFRRNITSLRGFSGLLGPTDPAWLHGSYLNTHTIQEAIRLSLDLVVPTQKSKFAKLVNKMVPGWTSSRSPIYDRFVQLRLHQWAFPSRSELEAMGDELQDDAEWRFIQNWYREEYTYREVGERYCQVDNGWRNREKYRFSATAVAIRFLGHLSARQRLSLQSLSIHEDQFSVGNPEFHAQGLFPFCKENPQLRIERRVSLWGNVFQTHELGGSLRQLSSWRNNPLQVGASSLSDGVASWLIGGLAVLDADIPPESITLLLDGEPALDYTAEIFKTVVQRDLAFALAFEPYSESIHSSRPNLHFCLEGFPRALRHLTNGTSIFRCNFNPGQFWDIHGMIDERQYWTALDHFRSWQQREPKRLDFCRYFPDWPRYLFENFEQEWSPLPETEQLI
ncbi:hypothetical protein NM208_g1499 [Fusarium decemcellulare]|uniref:Uncharacterized protein n=2 Tax=Fusarium decemcellulare TaxID=57161 RepID=A0ACC1RSG2_9HYPO|nr:hypothetical protein NM208_g11472 [Fusarium decemcellulare]KAJ3547475.1 hypothetical protein NM208_g1499 [Fusarium decemcellulare]